MVENPIDNFIEAIEDAIYNNPLPLLNIKDSDIISIINKYLPYSIGMEFECMKKETYDIVKFQSILNIMAVEVDNSEQRYRIPDGLKGMICLWSICTQMKLNSIIDLGSSNHYHFDFTDISDNEKHKIRENSNNRDWIIEELKLWGTALNHSMSSNWIRFFNPLGTLEIRIGEPTFDYNLIIKRLIQGSIIAKRLKEDVDPNSKLLELQKELRELQFLKKDSLSKALDEIAVKTVISNRIIKIN